MPLDPEYRQFVERQLDECDAALVGKPHLASVFDDAWRGDHRAKMLGANSRAEVSYPPSYAKPHQEMFYPPDYQARLEEGAAVLFPKFDRREKEHFIQRMRTNGGPSCEEELLLARGFAEVFGPDAISFPGGSRNKPRPEFHVVLAGRQIEIEAKGMLDSAEVQRLNADAIQSGEFGWCSFSPTIARVSRIQNQIAEKLLSDQTGDGRILVFTQYTPWPTPDEAIPLLREMATAPEHFNVPPQKHPLAVAYVTARWITGVWFNESVARRLGIDSVAREHCRSALRASFYPRTANLLFDESNSEQREQELIAEMIRVAYGG